MKKNLLPTLAIVLCLGPSLCLGNDGSTRRYAEFTGHDDRFLTFCLLEREDVQHALKMTAEQVAKVKHICNATDHEIPGLVELVASYRKRQSDPTLSASDRDKLRGTVNSDVKSCIDAYQRKELPATLSANQRQRIGELLIQMRGPIAVVDDAAVASKLQLSDEQLTAMRQVVRDYDAELRLLQGRYGRQQISGKRYANETPEDRQKELEGLFNVIRAIERERDGVLLQKLTPQQLVSWRTIQGRLFPIAWPATSVLDVPYGNGQRGRAGGTDERS